MRPPLMTERTELYGTGWRDCTQAAGMMGVWFGAQSSAIFPLGYTAQEREALERTDDKADEVGANINSDLVLAVRRRYGVDLRLQDGSLRAAFVAGTPDDGWVLAGNNGRWPAGDHYRRWDPAFGGNHATFAVAMGDGKNLWWFDPEAPDGYAGELISIDKVMQWSFGDGWARVVRAGEYRKDTPMAFQQATVPTGTWLYTYSDFRTDPNNIQVSPGRPMLVLKANAAAGGHLILHDTSLRHMYVRATTVTLQTIDVAGTAPTDCTAAVKAAVDPLAAQITQMKADLATAEAALATAEAARAKAVADGVANLDIVTGLRAVHAKL